MLGLCGSWGYGTAEPGSQSPPTTPARRRQPGGHWAAPAPGIGNLSLVGAQGRAVGTGAGRTGTVLLLIILSAWTSPLPEKSHEKKQKLSGKACSMKF